MSKKFFGCYLLASLDPKCKGRTYIGFTVNPRRRIRQHNGQIVNGAHRTKKGRPWDMALVLYGFPTKIHALQFEWAWQHPSTSLAVRDAYNNLTKRERGGVAGKIRLLIEMLRVEPFCFYQLTLQFLSSKYSAMRAGMPSPPPHVAVEVAPLDDLPGELLDDGVDGPEEGAELLEQQGFSAQDEPAGATADAVVESECLLCSGSTSKSWVECCCGQRLHLACLAGYFREGSGSRIGSDVPSSGFCPGCRRRWRWSEVLLSMSSAVWAKGRPARKPGGRRARRAALVSGAKAASGGTGCDPARASVAAPRNTAAGSRGRPGGSPGACDEPALPSPGASPPADGAGSSSEDSTAASPGRGTRGLGSPQLTPPPLRSSEPVGGVAAPSPIDLTSPAGQEDGSGDALRGPSDPVASAAGALARACPRGSAHGLGRPLAGTDGAGSGFRTPPGARSPAHAAAVKAACGQHEPPGALYPEGSIHSVGAIRGADGTGADPAMAPKPAPRLRLSPTEGSHQVGSFFPVRKASAAGAARAEDPAPFPKKRVRAFAKGVGVAKEPPRAANGAETAADPGPQGGPQRFHPAAEAALPTPSPPPLRQRLPNNSLTSAMCQAADADVIVID